MLAQVQYSAVLDRWHAARYNSLLSLEVRLFGILQETGILDGDLVTDVWGGSRALLENSLSDTHDC